MAIDTAPPASASPAPELPSQRSRARSRRLSLPALTLNRPAVVVIVLALTAISLLLRSRQLNFYYWIDEAISVGISSHPLAQLPHLLREDGSPPLYYLLLHVWMQIFGHGEVATHWLSLVFALIAVPVAYWGGASLFGRRVGFISAILAAGVPFLTNYAQETRMYSLALLLSLLTAIAFVHVFLLGRRRYLPLFSLSLVATMYTHNWGLFLAVATFIAYLVCVWASPEPRRPLWRDGLIGFGAAAILYLPWLPTLLYQAQHTGAPWALPPVIWSISQGFYFITGGRGAAVALLLASGTGLGTLRKRGGLERPLQIAAVSLAILALGTLLIAWLYAKTTPAWSGRYLAVVVGPLILLVALGLSRARTLGIVALALVCCFWVLDPRATQREFKSNVALVAARMRPHTGPTTLALSTQPEEVPAIAYYLPRIKSFATPLGRVSDPRVMDWRNALERFEHTSVRTVLAPIVRSLHPGDRVLLVIPAGFVPAPLWMALIHKTSKSWRAWLIHDPHLRLIKQAAPNVYSTGLSVRGYLFIVRS